MCSQTQIWLVKQAYHTSNTPIACCLGYTMVREKKKGREIHKQVYHSSSIGRGTCCASKRCGDKLRLAQLAAHACEEAREAIHPTKRFVPELSNGLLPCYEDFTRSTTPAGTTNYHPAECTGVNFSSRESKSTFDSHTLWYAIGCWRGSREQKSNAYASRHEDWYARALLWDV